MTILEELIEYANLCISDKYVSAYEDYISCKKHKNACKRFLRDVERATEGCFFYWDEKEAKKIVDWFAMLRHSKGILAGKPIELTPWQKFNLCQLYGWRKKEDGTKRFKKMFLQLARKQAKSQMLSGINLYEISVCSNKNKETYEAYTAGTKRDQSKIIFNECSLMLRGSPLATKFRITRDVIKYKDSFIKPLCKEDGRKGDGTNPAILTLDEYHQHQTTEFYDLFLGAAVKDPTLVIITTAGMDLTYPCYTQEYKYCSDILNPDIDIDNDEYLVDICELDQEDYADPKNITERALRKANPIRMTYKEGTEKILSEYEIAKQIPEKMVAFLTKCANVWVQAKENGYMDMAKWKACEVEKLPIDTYGRKVYVGFDMSAKIDLTSVAFIIPFKTGKTRVAMGSDGELCDEDEVGYIVYSHSFIPNREKLMERVLKDKVPYDAWEQQGYLTVTNTQIVDQSEVMKYVLETCKENAWEIECMAFDPCNASKLMMDLSDKGYDVEEVYQSHKSLNESTAGFREQVFEGNVYYLHNPVLNFAMSNAVIRQNNGMIKIDKDATTKKIDPVDAVLCAFKLALYHEFTEDYVKIMNDFIDSDW